MCTHGGSMSVQEPYEILSIISPAPAKFRIFQNGCQKRLSIFAGGGRADSQLVFVGTVGEQNHEKGKIPIRYEADTIADGSYQLIFFIAPGKGQPVLDLLAIEQ